MLFKGIHRNKLMREDGQHSELAPMEHDGQLLACLRSHLGSMDSETSEVDRYPLDIGKWLAITADDDRPLKEFEDTASCEVMG